MLALKNDIFNWQNLPCGIEEEVFIKNLSIFTIRDLALFSMVCKKWREFIHRDAVGTQYLNHLKLSKIEGQTWLTRCSRFFLSVPHMIALDVSGSMMEMSNLNSELRNIDFALQKACQIAQEIGTDLIYHGVDCLAFSNRVVWKKAYSVEEVYSFFVSNMTRNGTDIAALFNSIFSLQKENLNCCRLKSAQVSIISDFEDVYQLNEIIEENNQANIDFKCYLIKPEEQLYGNIFQDAIQEKFSEEGCTLEIRTRGEKRKREQERKLKLTFENLNLKEFLPKKKKQKIEKK